MPILVLTLLVRSHLQLPAITVAISAGLRWDDYGSDTNCWLSTSDGTIWAFVAPMLVIIAINLAVFFLAIKSIMHMGRKMRRRSSTAEEGKY